MLILSCIMIMMLNQVKNQNAIVIGKLHHIFYMAKYNNTDTIYDIKWNRIEIITVA